MPTSYAGSGLPFRDVDWTEWDVLLQRVHHPSTSVTVALVGKYVDLPDAYLSVTEALRAGGVANDARVKIHWVTSDDCTTPEQTLNALEGVDGVLVPGGFGIRGIEGKVAALRWARENEVPGAWPLSRPAVHGDRRCAPPRAGSPGPTAPSSTLTPSTPSSRRWLTRSASSPARPTWAARCAWAPIRPSSKREVSRRAPTASCSSQIATAIATRSITPIASGSSPGGLRFSGTSPDGQLVEVVELPPEVHPFYVGTQAHPEFTSRPTKAHPLFPGVHRRRRGPQRIQAARSRRALMGWPPALAGPGRRSARACGVEALDMAHDYEGSDSEPIF